jgi:hypothetical protein
LVKETAFQANGLPQATQGKRGTNAALGLETKNVQNPNGVMALS